MDDYSLLATYTLHHSFPVYTGLPPSSGDVDTTSSLVALRSSGSYVDALSIHLLRCGTCGISSEEPCWQHVNSVSDEMVVPLALASIPSVLSIQPITSDPTKCGVFADDHLPTQTLFGPLIAPFSPKNTPDRCNFGVRIMEGGNDDESSNKENKICYFDQESDYACNWMKYVRLATSPAEQNMTVCQHGNDVVFVSIKDIHMGDEMKVGYARRYGESIGKSLHFTGCNINNATDQQQQFQLPVASPKLISVGGQKRRRSRAGSNSVAKGSAKKNRVGRSRCSSNKKSEKSDDDDDSDNVRDQPVVQTKPIYSLRSRSIVHPPPYSRLLAAVSDVSEENAESASDDDSNDEDECLDDSDKDSHFQPSVDEMNGENDGEPSTSDHVQYSFNEKQYPEDDIARKVHLAPMTEPHSTDDDIPVSSMNDAVNSLSNEPEKAGEHDAVAVDKIATEYIHANASGHFDAEHYLAAERRNRYKYDWTFKCVHCPRCFRHEDLYKMHLLLRHDDPQQHKDEALKLTPCAQCGYKNFPTLDSMVDHIDQHTVHVEQRPQPSVSSAARKPCPICERIMASHSALRMHIKRIHPDSQHAAQLQLPKRCVVCGKEYDHHRELNQHVPTHEVDGGRYPCPQCPRTYISYAGMKWHLQTIHDVRSRRTCPICQKTFAASSHYKLHLFAHSTVYACVCEHCGKKFKRKTQLDEHVMNVHLKTKVDNREVRRKERYARGIRKPPAPRTRMTFDEMPFKCDECRLGYVTRGNLLRHIEQRHPDVPLDTVKLD